VQAAPAPRLTSGAIASVPAPRLASGAIASVFLHGGLIAAFLLMRGAPSRPSPPVISVQLFAAAAGPRAVGVVQPPPTTPKVETPPPTPAKTATPRERVATPKKTQPVPRVATPTPPTKTAEQPKTEPPQTTAGGGTTGGRGADVANVNIHGIEFPYKYYTDGIVREILRQFGTTTLRYVAEVRFVIHRDGSITGLDFVTRSGNYSFDQKAIAAVEAVGNAKAFGALPAGYREDILPVTFRFSPQLMR
jgi:protein TonB